MTWGVSPTSVVWADRVFASPHALGRWLSARRQTYEGWAALHPQGAAILTHQPWPPPLVGATPTTSSSAISSPKQSAVAAGSGLISELKLAVEILLLVLAGALLAAALTPDVVLSRGPPRLSYALQAHRPYVAMGAIAILLGYAVQALG